MTAASAVHKAPTRVRLYLMRHGIAAPRNSVTGGDAKRRLTTKGIRELKAIAKGMRCLKLSFDLILTSPYTRALQSARLVAKALDCTKILRNATVLQPGRTSSQVTSFLATSHGRRKRILLVGHEPLLSQMVSRLATGTSGSSVKLKKAGLCRMDCDPSFRKGTLKWLLTPSQLRLLTQGR